MQIVYISVLALIALVLFLFGMSGVEYEPLIGGGLMIGAVIFLIGGFALPSLTTEGKKANKVEDVYKELKQEAYDTKIAHGGISQELYDRIKENNEAAMNVKPNFWTAVLDYDEDDCIINLSEYKVISENAFVQPVRDINATESTAGTTTEPTTSDEPITEPTTEPVSESTTEIATLQSVVIDGKTYALVPVE